MLQCDPEKNFFKVSMFYNEYESSIFQDLVNPLVFTYASSTSSELFILFVAAHGMNCVCVVCVMWCRVQWQNILFLQEMHTIAEDLRLCVVKNMEDIERRFCFEIVAPTK